jgi:hypothetical protein
MVDDAGCPIMFDDDLESPSVGWALLGQAQAGAQGVVLTPQATEALAGAMWRRTALSFTGELRVVVDYSFETAGSNVGDGMTVAWLQPPPTYTLGYAGLSMGLCAVGMIGTAVQLDGYNSRLVVLNDFNNDCNTNGFLSGVQVEKATELTVEIRADRMTGTLNTGQTKALPKTIPTSGYLGITAATGASGVGQTSHIVHHVRVSSCP